jgi:hypothetical protein
MSPLAGPTPMAPALGVNFQFPWNCALNEDTARIPIAITPFFMSVVKVIFFIVV